MKHFQKILSGVGVAPLNAAIAAHPELWDQFSLRREIKDGPHSRMQDIWVRYRDINEFNGDRAAFNEEHTPIWYPAWEVLTPIKALVNGLYTLVGGESLGGILITRIPPGCGIDPHTDTGWHVETFSKYYVSLQSAPGAEFVCSHEGVQELIEPSPGDVWLFDNRKQHWVKNGSDQDRVTLIVCIRTKDTK